MTRSLVRPLTRSLTRSLVRGPSLDADTVAFQTASGATDVSGIDAIARYMRAQGLRDNYRLFPQKSAQNTGSGSTVYGIGGLTANNMTLVNSPTWGASGIEFNATNQFGQITDFLDAATITVMCRRSGIPALQAAYILSQFDASGDDRSWAMTSGASSASALRLMRSSLGTGATNEQYTSSGNVFGNDDKTHVAQWVDGGARSAWVNKDGVSLSLTSGTTQTARKNSAASILQNAGGTAASPFTLSGGTYAATIYLTGTLTTIQRETLTDLVNAL